MSQGIKLTNVAAEREIGAHVPVKDMIVEVVSAAEALVFSRARWTWRYGIFLISA